MGTTGADLIALVESGRFPGQEPPENRSAPLAPHETTGADLLRLVEEGGFPGQQQATPPTATPYESAGSLPAGYTASAMPPHLRREMLRMPASVGAQAMPPVPGEATTAGFPATIAVRPPSIAHPQITDADYATAPDTKALVDRMRSAQAELAARQSPEWAAIGDLEHEDLRQLNRSRMTLGHEALSALPKPRNENRLKLLNAARVRNGLTPVALLPGERTAGQVLSEEWKAENIPVAGGFIDTVRQSGRDLAADRIAMNLGRGTRADWEKVVEETEKEVREARGKTFGGEVAAVTAQSVPFMAEFLLAPGVGAAKSGASLLNKGSRLILNTAVQAATTSSGRILAETTRRAGSTYDAQPLADGQLQLVMVREGQPLGEAVRDAGVDTLVELFSERTGKALGVIGAPVNSAVRRAAGMKPIRTGVESFLARMGYHGVLEEMGEERIGELLREAATRMGAADLQQEVPTAKQLLVEAAAFSIPGVAGRTASGVMDALEKRRNRAGLYSIPDGEPGKDVSDVSEERQEARGKRQEERPREAQDGLEEGVHAVQRAADDHNQKESPAVYGPALLNEEGKMQEARGRSDAAAISATQEKIRGIRTQMRDLQRKLERTNKKDDREGILDQLDALSARAKTLRDEAANFSGPASLSTTVSPETPTATSAGVAAPPQPQPAAPSIQGTQEADPTQKLRDRVAAGRPVRGEPLSEDEVLATREPERESIVRRNLGIADKAGYERDAEDSCLIAVKLALPPAIADEVEWINLGWHLTNDDAAAHEIGRAREGRRIGDNPLKLKTVVVDPFGLDPVSDADSTLFKAVVKLVKGEDGVFRARQEARGNRQEPVTAVVSRETDGESDEDLDRVEADLPPQTSEQTELIVPKPPDHIPDAGKMPRTDDPVADLLRYERQKRYTSDTTPAILNADVELQELAARVAAVRRSENAEGSAEARAVRQREREQGYGDAAVMRWSREALTYAPLEDLPSEVRQTIQTMAQATLEHRGIRGTDVIESPTVRAALTDIAAGRTTGGADYDNQRRKMVALLMGELDDRTIGEKDLGVPERDPDEAIVKALEQSAQLPPGDPILVPKKPRPRPEKQEILSPTAPESGKIDEGKRQEARGKSEEGSPDEQPRLQPDGAAPAGLLGGERPGEGRVPESGKDLRPDDAGSGTERGEPDAGVGASGDRPLDAAGHADGGSELLPAVPGGSGGGRGSVRGRGGQASTRDDGGAAGQSGVEKLPRPEHVTEEGKREEAGGERQPEQAEISIPPEPAEQGSAVSAPSAPTDLFTITEDVETFPAGEVTRARANLAALKLAKEIVAADRHATEAEKRELVKYTSFASARELFDGTSATWRDLRDQVTRLIGHQAFSELKKSQSNAMFTSPEIVRWMYAAVDRMGAQPRHTLEPSMGVGHFVGAMPGDMRKVTTLTGVEMDPSSAMIAKLLYPSADIRVEGFEAAHLADNMFDLVVGNVPFGAYGIADKRYNTTITHRIHNYFIVRALDLARPGGMVAVITSAFTLNAQDAAVRREMHKRGDLVAAVRLNRESLPGTKVTADILFFRKRADGEKAGGASFIEAKRQPFKDKRGADQTAFVNEYFIDKPDMVVGEHVYGSQYGDSDGVEVEPREGKTLAKVFALLPDSVVKNAQVLQQEMIQRIRERPPVAAGEMLPAGAYQIHDGRIHRVDIDANSRRSAKDVEDRIAPDQKDRAAILMDLRKLIAIRDAALRVIRMQSTGGEAPENIIAAQRALEKAYDGFVFASRKSPRFMNGSHVHKRLREDQYTRDILRALEEADGKSQQAGSANWKKGKIFTGRIVEAATRRATADSLLDAIAISLDEVNLLDLPRMAELLGSSADAVREQLLAEELAFEDPSGALLPKEEYVSGDSRAKLRAAEAAAAVDAKFKRNVDALRAIVPVEWGAGQIYLQLGMPWIPLDIYVGFIEHLTTTSGGISVTYVKETNLWKIAMPARTAMSAESTSKWGTKEVHLDKMLDLGFQQRQPFVIKPEEFFNPESGRTETRPVADPVATQAAIEKLQQIKDEFRRWAFDHADRIERLVPLYNDLFNTLVPRMYDGKHMTFPGMNPTWIKRLYKHQRSVAHRIIASIGNVMVHHPPGAGKTVGYVAGAMELKRLGYVRGTAIVVHNKTVDDFAKEAQELYPAARVVVVSNKASERTQTLARLAASEADIVIMSHHTAKRIGMRDETIRRYFAERIEELEKAKLYTNDKITVRALSEEIKKLQVRMDNRLADLAKKQKTGLRWEDVFHGYALVYDESQALKNLAYVTGMKGVAGLGSASGNIITFDAHMKASWHNAALRGRGVVFGTGTPVANSLVELYTIMRYLVADKLKALGIDHLDAWVAQFGEVTAETERTVQATYRDTMRFRRFTNAGNLLRMYRDFADVVTEEELDANMSQPRPIIAKNSKGERDWEDVISPADEGIDRLMKLLAQFANWISSHYKEAKERGYNYLVITNIARAAGVDMRLFHPEKFHENPDGKINKAAANIARIWKETAEIKGTQLVFSEQGVNTADRLSKGKFSTYLDLVEKLVKQGIPREQIAIVQDVGDRTNPLFEKVRSGAVRVLIGNLAGMGVGVNVQDRGVAIHLIDPPWRPDQVAQGVGRFIRAWNMNAEVKLFRYAQINSGDEMLYNKLFVKLSGIKVVGSDNFNLRTVDEVDAKEFSLAEIQALASKNPHVLAFYKATQLVNKLTALQVAHGNQQAENISSAAKKRAYVKFLGGKKSEQASLAELLAKSEKMLPAEIDGQSFAKHKEFGAALKAQIAEIPAPAKDKQITKKLGKVRGLNLFVTRRPKDTMSNEVTLRLVMEDKLTDDNRNLMTLGSDHEWFTTADPTGLATRVGNLIDSQQQEIAQYDASMIRSEAEAKKFDAERGPFGKAKELKDALSDLTRLDTAVKAYEQETAAAAAASELAGTDELDGLRGLGDLMAIIDEMRERTKEQYAQTQAMISGSDVVGDDEEGGGSGSEKPFPPGPERAFPEGMFPRDMTPEARKFLGRLRTEGRVAFGMGGTLNVNTAEIEGGKWNPVAAYKRLREYWWKPFFDRQSQRMQAAALRNGTFTEKVANGVVGGLWGMRMGLPDSLWLAFRGFHGGKKLAVDDAKRLVTQAVDRIADVDDITTTQAFRDAFNGVVSRDETPESARRILDIYQEWLDGAFDEIVELTGEDRIETLGKNRTVMEVVRKRRAVQPYFARRYYAADTPAAAEVKTAKLKKKFVGVVHGKAARSNVPFSGGKRDAVAIGPRLTPGMFSPRRSDKDSPLPLWNLRHADGMTSQFATREEVDEAYALEIDLNLPHYGDRIYQLVKIESPYGEEVRVELQEITDPMERMLRTVMDVAHNLESARLFALLRETGVAVSAEVAENAPADAGLVHLTDHPSFGPIAGMYVPQATHNNIMEMRTVHRDTLHRLATTYMYAWKGAHVKYSSATWMRNTVSKVFDYTQAGISPVTHPKLFHEAWQKVQAGLDDPDWRTLREFDRVQSGFATEDLDSLEKVFAENLSTDRTRAALEWWNSHAQSRAEKMLRSAAGKGLDVAKTFDVALSYYYDILNDVGIMAKFLHSQREEGLTPHEAIHELWMFSNYNDIGTFFRMLRDLPFIGMPFASFTDWAIKAHLGAMRNHPGRLMAVYAIPAALTLLTKVMLGLDDDELAAIAADRRKKGIGYFQPIIPVRDADGRVMRWDLRYIYPLTLFGNAAPGGLEIPFLFQQPIGNAVLESYANKNLRSGGQIADPDDPVTTRLWDHGINIAKNLAPLPSLAMYHIPAIWAAMDEELPPRQLARMVVSALTGLTFTSVEINARDAVKVLRQKLDTENSDAFERFMELYNETYKKRDSKPLNPRSVIRDYAIEKARKEEEEEEAAL